MEGVPLVNFFEDVSANDNMKVGFHEVKDQVEVLVVVSFQEVGQANDVVMAKLLQEHDFPKCSLGISSIVKGIKNLFECNNQFRFPVDRLPHYTIRAFAELLLDFILLKDVGFYFLGHLSVKILF